MTHAEWITFLQTQGAALDTEGQVSFTGQTDSPADSIILTPLTHLRALALQGPDSETFLQGQVTCDVNQATPEHSVLGSVCTHKGGVVALFRVIKQADGELYLRTATSTAETLRAHLAKYIVFSKAEIGICEHVGLGLSGAGASAALKSVLGAVPEAIESQILVDDCLIIRVPGNERFELWLPAAKAQALWQQLSDLDNVTRAGTNSWLLAEIENGLAQISAEFSGEFIPQMLNLQAINAVSFKKGCYTGQEIVARLQHRGVLKKLMYRCQTGTEVVAGTALNSPEREKIGTVIATATRGDTHEFLAVINKQAADGNHLSLALAGSPGVELLPLPYAIDPELFTR